MVRRGLCTEPCHACHGRFTVSSPAFSHALLLFQTVVGSCQKLVACQEDAEKAVEEAKLLAAL